jgi:hypothetical protein
MQECSVHVGEARKVMRSNDDMLPRPSSEGRKGQSRNHTCQSETEVRRQAMMRPVRHVYLVRRRLECKAVGTMRPPQRLEKTRISSEPSWSALASIRFQLLHQLFLTIHKCLFLSIPSRRTDATVLPPDRGTEGLAQPSRINHISLPYNATL